MSLSIRVDHHGTITIVRPNGRVTFSDDADVMLHQLFSEQIAAGCRRFVLDLSHVTFVDSNGLAQMVGALHDVRVAGGDIKAFGAGKRLSDAMILVRINELFDIYDEEGSAIAAYV